MNDFKTMSDEELDLLATKAFKRFEEIKIVGSEEVVSHVFPMPTDKLFDNAEEKELFREWSWRNLQKLIDCVM